MTVPTNTRIRAGTPQDFDAVRDINYQIYVFESANCDPSANKDFPFSEKGEAYVRQILGKEEGYECLVALVDEVVVGYVAIKIFSDEETSHRNGVKLGQIHTLGVTEKFRDQGIGSLLVEKAVDRVGELGANRLRVVAFSNNERAIGLYHKYGFGEFEITFERGLS